MTDYLRLPLGDNAPKEVNAVVEIARGEVNKYEYDKTLNVLRLDRNLHSPVHYPGDYGFVPSTLSEDGDPLDVLILVDSPSFSSCVIQVRPIGVLEMIDQGVKDEKLLAVGLNDPHYKDVKDFSGVYSHVQLEIEHFFSVYKDLEGKRTKIIGWQNAEHAREVVRQSHQRYLSRTPES